MEPYEYDGIIVITASDLERVVNLLPRMKANMPVRRLVFVGSKEVGDIVSNLVDVEASFINENDIIPFECINDILKKRLKTDNVPRGITGWYYQQFLKMGYAKFCKDEYYLVWDGDTIPCDKFSMFSSETGQPYLDIKNEYNEEYFITMGKILPGFRKIIEQSFIAEHMLFNSNIMLKLISTIEANDEVYGETFYEKILYAVRDEALRTSSFSEFETYGTFVALTNNTAYKLRDWHSLRFAAFFFKAEEMTDDDFAWLSKDFHAMSFEKGEAYHPEYAEFFHNPHYRDKLRARDIVNAIWDQGAVVSNVVEKWN